VTTPPGWYDDGSGHQRWWDGLQWTGHVATPVVMAAPVRQDSHLWWALSPVYLCGLVSFIPALHAAMKLRRRDLWYWSGGLIAGNVLVWGLVVSGPSGPDAPTTPVQAVGTSLAIVLTAVGTTLALRLRGAVFPPYRGVAAIPVAVPQQLDPAIANSLAARRRRVETAALCTRDPGLAHDLRVGRPDLTRQYNDGGLIDVNHVPEAILVSHLGFSQDQARTAVDVRNRIGGFLNADDLCSHAGLPIAHLDAMRDRIITL
jgi:hypothetical protein